MEYTFEVTVQVDDADRRSIIGMARRNYVETGGTYDVDDNGVETLRPAEVEIDCIEEALSHLLFYEPYYEKEFPGIGHLGVSYKCDQGENHAAEQLSEAAANEPTSDAAPSHEATPYDDMDEPYYGVFLCRWPDGTFSIVAAATKRDAIIELDELGPAHPSYVYPMEPFLADFCLTSEGDIVLARFGEETRNSIWETCYPELRDVLDSEENMDDTGEVIESARERIRQAVEHECTRLWDNQPEDEAKTELGKRIAKRLGTSAVVADHYVDVEAERILESDEGEGGKTN